MFKNMGGRHALLILLSLNLSKIVFGASLDRKKLQTLIYDEDITHDVKRFCEFAPKDSLRGVFENKCYVNNPRMRMIRDGKTLYPWRTYSGGKKGIILECPPHGMNKSLCSNGHRLYSVCTVSCSNGFVNTTDEIECQIKGPLKNVSAEWSTKNFCEPLSKGTKKATSNEHISITTPWLLGLLVAAFIMVPVVVSCVILQCKRKKWCLFRKGQSPRTSASTSCSSIPQYQQQVGNIPERGISEKYFPMSLFGSDHLSSAASEQYEFGEGDAETPLNEAPTLFMDEEDEMRGMACAPKLSEEFESLVKNKSRDALSINEEDELNGGIFACKLSIENESSMNDESIDDFCTVLIQEVLDPLKLKEVRKLGSMLEYYSGRKREHTLYGYVMENWKNLGFSSICEVEVLQARSDYRNEDTPVEYFLKHLTSCGVSIRDVLKYFHDQGAEQAIAIWLEFHECECCKKKFASVSSH